MIHDTTPRTDVKIFFNILNTCIIVNISPIKCISNNFFTRPNKIFLVRTTLKITKVLFPLLFFYTSYMIYFLFFHSLNFSSKNTFCIVLFGMYILTFYNKLIYIALRMYAMITYHLFFSRYFFQIYICVYIQIDKYFTIQNRYHHHHLLQTKGSKHLHLLPIHSKQ